MGHYLQDYRVIDSEATSPRPLREGTKGRAARTG